jgi:hypothetical protein
MSTLRDKIAAARAARNSRSSALGLSATPTDRPASAQVRPGLLQRSSATNNTETHIAHLLRRRSHASLHLHIRCLPDSAFLVTQPLCTCTRARAGHRNIQTKQFQPASVGERKFQHPLTDLAPLATLDVAREVGCDACVRTAAKVNRELAAGTHTHSHSHRTDRPTHPPSLSLLSSTHKHAPTHPPTHPPCLFHPHAEARANPRRGLGTCHRSHTS